MVCERVGVIEVGFGSYIKGDFVRVVDFSCFVTMMDILRFLEDFDREFDGIFAEEMCRRCWEYWSSCSSFSILAVGRKMARTHT